MKRILAVCFLMSAFAVASQGSTSTFLTPSGSTTKGGPVDAGATITTGDGVVTVVLRNFQANPKDVTQAISNFEFALSEHETTGSLVQQAVL